jgi:hypothetical protein
MNVELRLSPYLPISLSPYLLISLSPYLPISLSPYLPISLSPYTYTYTYTYLIPNTQYPYTRKKMHSSVSVAKKLTNAIVFSIIFSKTWVIFALSLKNFF